MENNQDTQGVQNQIRIQKTWIIVLGIATIIFFLISSVFYSEKRDIKNQLEGLELSYDRLLQANAEKLADENEKLKSKNAELVAAKKTPIIIYRRDYRYDREAITTTTPIQISQKPEKDNWMSPLVQKKVEKIFSEE